MAWKLRN